MKKKSYDDEIISLVRDRGYHNFSLYRKKSWAIDFKYNDGKLLSWVLLKDKDLITSDLRGDRIKDFILYTNKMKRDMQLKVYSKDRKDIQIIWCRNLDVIRGFFTKYITEDFGMYVQISNVYEFREITTWNEDLKKASIEDIAYYGQTILDEVFIPNKYFYVTPNQIIRKKLKKGVKEDEALIKEINPKSYEDYKYIRSALFGGLCFCPYPRQVFDEPMLALDLTSAYIYDMLICKHCMSSEQEENPNYWNAFLGMQERTSIGTYKIKYSCVYEYIKCFKDVDGRKLEQGTHEVEITLNNYDLELLLDIATIQELKCMQLYSYKLDYLPQYVRDCLVAEYTKKQELKPYKEERHAEYITQKKIVNGIFGDSIRKYDEDEWNKVMKHPYLPMQAGVWTTSYCKKFLFELASKVDGWIYSDTDSIYCYDTLKNRKLIEEFNATIRESVKKYCNDFEYDYDILKDLGTFDIEHRIKKFRAFKQKEYCFITDKDEVIVKAAGIEKRKWTKELVEQYKLFDKETEKIPYKVTIPFLEEGSYEEMTFEGSDAERMLEAYALAYTDPSKLDSNFLKKYVMTF